MEAYEKYWDSVSVERTLLSDSYAAGIHEGKLEGKLEGKTETIEQIVIRGYSEGVPVEVLSRMAGLHVDEVTRILEK
jgi:predicted transposase YdaD